ncbi:TetR/AcrR family transcriptional regulator [uncultured Sphingomonas sp.]|uniref:TetR/AcrR family transcriptional regulator n=1 Tax=uncultured Sphingomonas sp. TaxID=158754 RepID=UPI0035C9DF74
MPRGGLSPAIVTEAAAAIVDAHGLAALTLARLAARLGVAPPSLYKHIGGQDDLILRVSTLSLRWLNDALTTAAMARAGRAALGSIAHAYRRFAIDHAGLYTLTQGPLRPDSDAQQTEARRVVAVFDAVIASYGVPDALSVHAIRVVRASLHGFVDIEARGGFQLSQSVDESFELVVEAAHGWLTGLCPHPSAEP